MDRECSLCKINFPLTENYFYKNGNGFQPYCKTCSKSKSRKWALDNPDNYIKSHRKSRKKTRLKIREQRKYSDWRPSGKQLQWQRNNKEKLIGYRINRASKKHNITLLEWEFCKKYFNQKCAYCGLNLDEHFEMYNQDFHRDHVNHSGENNLSNCVPSCKRCNSSKWEYEFEIWYKENEFYSVKRHQKILKWLNTDYKIFIKDK